jgi:8-oxo-dGTP pyrophosphatase MutT (NUDIX family)
VRFSEVEPLLRRALAEPLPGVDGQLLLAPRPRRGWQPGTVPDDCRIAAALVLVYPDPQGDARVVLTVRHADLPFHAGQVSLPGGAVRDGETLEQTALREANEEVAIDPAVVRVCGRLTPLHIPVSGFVLHPIVGTTPERPELRACPREVDRVLEPALAVLAETGRWRVETRAFRGADYRVPVFDLDGALVWGATAMVLGELLSALGRPPNPWRADEPDDP